MNRVNNNNPKGYLPVVQKPYCCVPASLQMVFNRHGIKGFSQERIGRRLGLVVPRSAAKHFKSHVLTHSDHGGYGTQCDQDEYNLPDALRDWALPLTVRFKFASSLNDKHGLALQLQRLRRDEDCLLSVQSGFLEGQPHKGSGHVMLLSAVTDNGIVCIDPHDATFKHYSYCRLFKAIQRHDDHNMGGLWILRKAKTALG